MKLKALAVAAVALVGTGLGAVPAHAESTWHATLLPLPAGGGEDTYGFLVGTDGHGGYAGEYLVGDTSQVVTWTDGRPTVRGVPAGYEWAGVTDENSSGTVLGNAVDYDTGLSRGFLLDGNGFHLLPVAPGYVSTDAVALNDRGDVLTYLVSSDQNKTVGALWPAFGSGPATIPTTGEWARVVDVDQDGTVLTGDALWRNGVLTPLKAPAGLTSPSGDAIRNGVVVGSCLTATSPNKAVRWATPDRPEVLPDGDEATDLNGAGLIGGQLPNQAIPNAGAPYLWQDSTPIGKLPLPDGFDRGDVKAIGDDGTVVGVVSSRSLDEGGAPVIWQR
ncbi:hypothetical protein VSH64_42235 [Amycolatopsis rhabdoformis]|uniref:Uncharacterized protein n=1 Tax=Amycolatopsis rhabdoformis TaxID=1448059 RepID=A0ABZ1I6B2_9PSEU|nr:hypothetical protein [Amycolatopsis rhabdoformis]WSE29357.1 hypothetical protein VSH64_42235 [Amycolatopsis rhabdoformis]